MTRIIGARARLQHAGWAGLAGSRSWVVRCSLPMRRDQQRRGAAQANRYPFFTRRLSLHSLNPAEISDAVGLRKRIAEKFELASLPGTSEADRCVYACAGTHTRTRRSSYTQGHTHARSSMRSDAGRWLACPGPARRRRTGRSAVDAAHGWDAGPLVKLFSVPYPFSPARPAYTSQQRGASLRGGGRGANGRGVRGHHGRLSARGAGPGLAR